MASRRTAKLSERTATSLDIASEAGRCDALRFERVEPAAEPAFLAGAVNAAALAARALHSDDKVSAIT